MTDAPTSPFRSIDTGARGEQHPRNRRDGAFEGQRRAARDGRVRRQSQRLRTTAPRSTVAARRGRGNGDWGFALCCSKVPFLSQFAKVMARHIESADLPEDIARLAEAQVAAGRFASVEEVVRAGVEAIATVEQKRAAIRAALEEGEASGVFEGDAFASVSGRARPSAAVGDGWATGSPRVRVPICAT